MENIPLELFQISPIAIIFIFAIREVFSWLKSKKISENYPTKTECDLKHKFLDSMFSLLDKKAEAENNHLHTLEEKIKLISENQVKIFTILEERLPNKK